MNPEPSAEVRDDALRAVLVNKADAAKTRRPRTRMTRRALIASVAAFTLAGGLTGGAVSAVALASDHARTTVIDVDTSVRQRAVLGDARPMGTPFTYVGSGNVVLELGAPPEGATDFIYLISCQEPGTFVKMLDGDESTRSTTTCDEQAASSSFGGSGGQFAASGGDSHVLTITSSARYSVWGTWAAEPAPPTASAAQNAAMEDGIVTRDEYVVAYQRFSACMSEAGFPLVFVDLNKTVIEYSTTQEAETDGASARCYGREFLEVDQAWQIANEDTSETARVLGECLRARGIAPGATLAEKEVQLEAAGIRLQDCG